MPITPHGPLADVPRSTEKPCSFVELSAHVRLIWLADTEVAVSADGAAGTVADAGVAADTTLEYADEPDVLNARTRK